jgi:hypothetical protein
MIAGYRRGTATTPCPETGPVIGIVICGTDLLLIYCAVNFQPQICTQDSREAPVRREPKFCVEWDGISRSHSGEGRYPWPK